MPLSCSSNRTFALVSTLTTSVRSMRRFSSAVLRLLRADGLGYRPRSPPGHRRGAAVAGLLREGAVAADRETHQQQRREGLPAQHATREAQHLAVDGGGCGRWVLQRVAHPVTVRREAFPRLHRAAVGCADVGTRPPVRLRGRAVAGPPGRGYRLGMRMLSVVVAVMLSGCSVDGTPCEKAGERRCDGPDIAYCESGEWKAYACPAVCDALKGNCTWIGSKAGDLCSPAANGQGACSAREPRSAPRIIRGSIRRRAVPGVREGQARGPGDAARRYVRCQ